MQLLGRVAEQERFAKWDTDGDGALSPSEVAECDARLASYTIVQPDGDVRRRRRDEDHQSPTDQAAILTEIEAEHGALAAKHARDALEWHRFSRLCNPRIQETGMRDLLMFADTVAGVVHSEGPTAAEGISDHSNEAKSGASAPSASLEQEAAREAAMQAHMLADSLPLVKYHVNSSRYDADANARIDGPEWDARVADELARGAAATRQLYCDADGDGTIGDLDLMRFIQWFGSHRPRADINGDGRFDSEDLQQLLGYYHQ